MHPRDQQYPPVRRDMRLWTCDDCEAAYRAWACSVAFRRCNTTDPSGFMVPTCDDVCWATVRQCPATQQFSCPNNVRFCHKHNLLAQAHSLQVSPCHGCRQCRGSLCHSCSLDALHCGRISSETRPAVQWSLCEDGPHAETLQQ